ncbi:MAG: hypothetical protein QOE36_1487 [Gaiellaceae bacterium]|nr:hypothetical protein [Gaiellaceae bacterium]
MRWLLATAFVALAALATADPVWRNDPAAFRVSIGTAMPSSEIGDENPPGTSLWSVYPAVTVRGVGDCTPVGTSTSTVSFDGNRIGARGQAESLSLERHGETARTRIEGYGNAGEDVELSVEVGCGGRRATARRTFALPPATCDRGPTRAYVVVGRAERRDDNAEGRWVPIRSGDLVGVGADVRIGRHGRVVVGGAECNGFRMVLRAGTYIAGGYDRADRGNVFEGTRVLGRGDGHAGSFVARAGIEVMPIGRRCSGCGETPISSYEVRSGRSKGDPARVRVYRGAVLVRAGSLARRVLAGQEATGSCTPDRRVCRLNGPELFQPGESWHAALRAGVRPLGRAVFTPAGWEPSVRALAPPGAHATLTRIRAGGGEPGQAVVTWSRDVRTTAGATAGQLREERGVLLWQDAGRRWNLVLDHRFVVGEDQYEFAVAHTADATGDGHADVLLVDETGGSGGCARYTLVATVSRRLHVLLRKFVCDGSVAFTRHGVESVEGVGPCPIDQGAHCYGGTRRIFQRWSGTVLVDRKVRIHCAEARLDPVRGCRPRKR